MICQLTQPTQLFLSGKIRARDLSRDSYNQGLFLAILAFVIFFLGRTAFGVTPAPDGGYPGQNTAEGEDALLNLSTGTRDTAIGFQALLQNTSGVDTTAIGAGALYSNTSGYDNYGQRRLSPAKQHERIL